MTERPASERVTLTSAGRQHLRDEATRLEARLNELRELLEDARADRTADDDERAAALGLLDEHSRAEARLADVRALLEMSADAPPVSTDFVGVGTRVRVREDDGTEEEFILVSPAEASAADRRVSVNSPIGQALAGKRPGERASVAAPSGAWEIEVISIAAAD